MRISYNTFDVSYCYWIIIIGTILCPILWLGSPKDMKFLCTISVVSVCSVFVLVSACLIFNNSTDFEAVNDGYMPERPLWETILTAYGIIAFQFDIHPSILTIQVDMKEPKKLTKALLGGFFVSVSMAGVTTVIAALKYGAAVQPSILETLPSSVALHFAAALVALQLCLTSALSNSALYQHMEDCLGISRYFNPKRCILRTILTLLAIILAESVPRFDLVMSLIGGTLTGPLMFILPPLIYIKMLSLHKTNEEQIQMKTFTNTLYSTDEKGRLKKITRNIPIENETKTKIEWSLQEKIQILFCVLIIVVSSAMTGITTYFNFNNAMNYANFSRPCIYNISASLLYL
ncbi:unnamed protein product [Brassicogethes aeneus]|uniref:Amino acid transporter transmembrane domain-containing protein n=1 Tax=Brassicogethes aeneus TaxID=1431903 RepID=A0A9P0FIU0_BRAAE|nr:unnamed protein product [Brassicogethes aeneus]